MAFKIVVDQDTCIGCGACAAQCGNFELTGDKAKVKKAKVAEIGCNKEAADICPVNAIKVTEI